MTSLSEKIRSRMLSKRFEVEEQEAKAEKLRLKGESTRRIPDTAREHGRGRNSTTTTSGDKSRPSIKKTTKAPSTNDGKWISRSRKTSSEGAGSDNERGKESMPPQITREKLRQEEKLLSSDDSSTTSVESSPKSQSRQKPSFGTLPMSQGSSLTLSPVERRTFDSAIDSHSPVDRRGNGAA